MSEPWRVSLKELQEKAKNSPLRKGMIVRCLPMGGSWYGFEGAEFYVLSDKAEPMWGHPMAVRHVFDVEPDSAEMFAHAWDKNGKVLFHYTHLPADCVVVLDQDEWTEKDENIHMADNSWREQYEERNRKDQEAYERWKARWEETGKEEHKRWMDLFVRCLNQPDWSEAKKNQNGIFKPELLDLWDESKGSHYYPDMDEERADEE